jgi:hypothetical protein
VACREPERSESDRSATEGNTVSTPEPRPNSEVVAQAKRRRYTAEYKESVLAEADQARGSGGLGALLRREGLYSSALVSWLFLVGSRTDAVLRRFGLACLLPVSLGSASLSEP